eukprot:5633580-Lingulodinium_polyedra.AAC.1
MKKADEMADEPGGFPAWGRIGRQLRQEETTNHFGVYMMRRSAAAEPPGAPARAVPRVADGSSASG